MKNSLNTTSINIIKEKMLTQNKPVKRTGFKAYSSQTSTQHYMLNNKPLKSTSTDWLKDSLKTC